MGHTLKNRYRTADISRSDDLRSRYPSRVVVVHINYYCTNSSSCMTNEIINLIANLALALSFIVGLIFGIAQVRTSARDRRERLTLETLRQFQTREFVELLHYVSFHDLPSNREGMMALPPDERTLLIQFGQEMESLGILVAERLIDIDLVD